MNYVTNTSTDSPLYGNLLKTQIDLNRSMSVLACSRQLTFQGNTQRLSTLPEQTDGPQERNLQTRP